MQTILTINGGSSSLKCTLFKAEKDNATPIYQFKLGNILGDPRITLKDGNGDKITPPSIDVSGIDKPERHKKALSTVLEWLAEHTPHLEITAFGHRVVHGGEQYSAPVLINEHVLKQLKTFIPLAPLHQPYNLLLIEACQALAPELPQIACFDTMFHVGQPAVERHYAIPRKFTEEGIHRYGFHGLSYEYIQKSLSHISDKAGKAKTIVCHLGAGASMCATLQGKSIASTMGFTAVDGLPMGSRCGNLDPGVLLYLQRHHHMDTDALEKMIYQESGWLGVSGLSSDMLTLHQANTPQAEEAIDMLAYRIALELGRLSAALGGLEQIVFTGGIGENDADLRERVLNRSQWLGVVFDEKANTNNLQVISTELSKITVRVIPTNEEAMIALHTLDVIDA
ncbi:acetate/propionate family kinase [Neptunomonas qingdaonensis]|uniref:Acetate kinase n=1 Tax=Neptunomonas qingdaonensis TaxID=1045558 RepID=A0A1I2RZB0_9GAMM|nr:acetate/propionate family kinase [Neptunomonas qingdaonensis]SFG45830.1 acetate kinase [Neptunomonas qingdaonensis]